MLFRCFRYSDVAIQISTVFGHNFVNLNFQGLFNIVEINFYMALYFKELINPALSTFFIVIAIAGVQAVPQSTAQKYLSTYSHACTNTTYTPLILHIVGV